MQHSLALRAEPALPAGSASLAAGAIDHFSAAALSRYSVSRYQKRSRVALPWETNDHKSALAK
jgi:hypothetical protein